MYRATVKTNSSVKQYMRAAEGTTKQRIYNHNLSFPNRNYSSNTSLSTYIWHLKDMNISPTITWEILRLAPVFNKTSRKCLFCPHEKLAIINYPSQNTAEQKNQKFYPNRRTNIFSHISTHTHNPSILPIPPLLL